MFNRAKNIEKNVMTAEEKMVKIAEKMGNFIGELKSRKKKSSENSRSKTGSSNSTMIAIKSVLVLLVCDRGSSQDCMAEHKNHKNKERKILQFRNKLVNGKKTLLLQKAIYVILHVRLYEKVIIDGNFSPYGFNSTIDTQKRGSVNWKAGQ